MKKTLTGRVVSTKMNKTVTVLVVRSFRHPIYKKVVYRGKKYLAHNEKLTVNVGDKVKIEQSKPLSRRKHFIVIERLTK